MNLVSFRKEAISAQADTLFGAPLIAQTPRVAVLVVALVLASVSFLAFAGWAQYTRKEHVVGYLAPTRGLIKVFTPQAGTVLERRVAEGQSVRQGEVLLVVSSERSSASTRDAQAAVLGQLAERRESLRREQDKQAEIDGLSAAAVEQRIRSLNAEIEQGRTQIELQRARVASAELAVKRQEGLVAAHFVSEAALQQKNDELLDQRGQLANLNRTIAGLTRDIDAARTELATGRLKRANTAAQIDRQMSELTQQLTEADSRRAVVLTASADGTVTTILAEVGQTVSPAAPWS